MNESSILGQIVRDTRHLTATRKVECPLSSLESMAGFERTPLSLYDALQTPALSIIAEIKKASPSKGVIRESFDPVEIAQSYERGGAAAVSVLSEPFHFQGELSHLQSCREVLNVPILRKDFIVDPYQIAEARAYGADAILLIATCLERTQASELLDAADEMGLSVLFELYHERELDTVDLDRTSIVGVNSRDLNTFEVDLERAINVLLELPEGVVRVAESGIRGLDDLIRLKYSGIQAALIGEALMKEEDPGLALGALTEQLS